jgi:hypothetical protein
MVFTSTVDYRRNVYVAACPQRPVAARVNPDFGTLGECVRGSGYRLAWSLRWTDRRKTGIVSDSQRPCLHCFVYGTRCPRSYAPVAQWIEYCPPKAGVAGSIPAGRTKNSFKINEFLTYLVLAQVLYGNCTEIKSSFPFHSVG